MKTSPYLFYQFWLKASDDDAMKWIKIFTLLPIAVIDTLISEHHQDPAKRVLQKRLAQEITDFVHGREATMAAQTASEKLFSGNPVENLQSMSETEFLISMDGVPRFALEAAQLRLGIDVVTMLAETGIFPSKGEARKTIQGGGLSLNRVKVTDIALQIKQDSLLNARYLLVQKGKNNFYLVEVA